MDMDIKHYFSAGVYAKETHVPAGHWLVQHTHKFSHLSILASGSVEFMIDGVVNTLHAPACLTVEANKHHGVKSLTDVVWYCIHATNCTSEDEIDEVLIAPVDPTAIKVIADTLSKES